MAADSAAAKGRVGHAALGPGPVESQGLRTQARFPDAERLVKRRVAQELTLSFVPDAATALADRCDALEVLGRVRITPSGHSLYQKAQHAFLSHLRPLLARRPAVVHRHVLEFLGELVDVVDS